MPKLCLFDASGYIHRAFHALPPMTNSKGEAVHAVYGFSRMISKVLREEKPDSVAVCFDYPAATFRHVRYVEYKANRSETDAGLVSQIPLAEELAQAWGLPCIKKEGFEADDIIATLAQQAQKKGFQILILSGDKDILQLVRPGIVVRDEIKRVDYDEDKVKDRYGVTPTQLVDLLSLMGDKVDNLPGVPGVGEKTAAKLLNEYGSIESLFGSINGKAFPMKEKLLQNRDRVFLNRDLIRLKDDVPLALEVKGLRIQPPEAEPFKAILKRLEFRGTLYGAENFSYEADLQINTQRKVRVVLGESDLKDLVEALRAASRIAYDVETDDLNQHRCGLVGVSLATRPHEGWYIPVGHRYMGVPVQLSWGVVKSALAPFLEDQKIEKCGQNVKFDNTVLACAGLKVRGTRFDTMVAAYCIDPARTSYGLKDLAADYLHERMTRIDELIGKDKGANFSEVDIHQAAPYAAADAEVVWRLVDIFSKEMAKEGVVALFEGIEMPLVHVIQEMESAGIAVDIEFLRKTGERFRELGRKLEDEIYVLCGERFVLNSPKQLARILFEKLKLPPVKRTKTGYSTDEEVLAKLAVSNPVCEKIIAYRELAKLSSTYVDSLLALASSSGRVHTSFHQTGTITGRLSSSNPNLQNIPIRSEQGREIRKSFVAPAGSILVSADYSQIDLRALAHISGDPTLIETFKAGGDVHRATAAQIFKVPIAEVTDEMRRRAKAINFGVVYGQQAYALSQSLGIEFAEAKDFISKYFERYAGVRSWIDRTLDEARKNGVVSTLAGRKRKLPDINSPSAFARGFAERVAINTPIQGSSADIIKVAMIRLSEEIGARKLRTRMLVQVHDELLFEVPESEEDEAISLIREGMESAFQLKVPILVDIKKGKNWNDMEKQPVRQKTR